MSDEANRNEAGQFASDAVPESITEQRELTAGYVPLADEAITGEAPAEDAPLTVEEASLELTNSRTAEAGIQRFSPVDAYLETLPENTTLSLEQASKLTTDAKEAEAKAAEEAQLQKVRDEVDKARGVEADPIDAVDGLDAETRRALKIPQVREALESEFTKIDQTRSQYTAALTNAQQFAQAAFFEAVPELSGLPLDQVERGLEMLAQVDPQRFQVAINHLNRVGQIHQAQQQAAQHQSQIQHQQFEQHVRSEDARLVQMVGEKAATEANEALVTYLADHGVPKDQMLSVVVQNPVLRSAEARQTIWKAARYDAIQKAGKPQATKSVPSVVRPGVSNAVRASTPLENRVPGKGA